MGRLSNNLRLYVNYMVFVFYFNFLCFIFGLITYLDDNLFIRVKLLNFENSIILCGYIVNQVCVCVCLYIYIYTQ